MECTGTGTLHALWGSRAAHCFVYWHGQLSDALEEGSEREKVVYGVIMDCSAQRGLLFLAESWLGNSHLRAFETLTWTWLTRKVLQPSPQSSESPLLGLSLAERATSWKPNLGPETIIPPDFNTGHCICGLCLTLCFPSCLMASWSSFQASVEPVAH